jgi:hypothetical protein
MQYAEFRSDRSLNAKVGFGFPLFAVAIFYVALFGSEEQLLRSGVQRGGAFVKLIEQVIGWDLFSALMVAFGAWMLVYSVVSLWKAIDPTPDVSALADRLEFHPAVKRSASTYDDVSHWSVEIVSGHPVLWIHLRQPYWSLQGLFRRKTIKLEGSADELTPLMNYFSLHPVMRGKSAE